MANIRFGYLHRTIIIHCMLFILTFAQNERQFIYNGFHADIHLHLDGLANIRPNGLLQLTNSSVLSKTSHAFYPHPMTFNPNQSFSTMFVFAMHPEVPHHSSGIAFVISPSMNFKGAMPSEYLGLFNTSTNGLSSNHVFAVELDTVRNVVLGDIDDNHVGVDINSLRSIDAASAAYYPDEGGPKRSIDLTSGKAIQVWVDYNGEDMILNVTMAPLRKPKPTKSLLSTRVNLSSLFFDSMYIGFSSCTGLTANQHYILGWSWSQSGQARELDPSKLPRLPRYDHHKRHLNPIVVVFIVILLILLIIIATAAYIMRRRKYNELQESWEQEYAAYRFCYKDLYVATKGFKDSELLGSGGFGKVYKGVLPTINTQVAVKRVSHDSRQGMKEFVAEIVSMGKTRHRNLVQLLGYCRREGELILVYDYMSNGSLDKFLFKRSGSILTWPQRFAIIKGVASALLYLHEGCDEVILHRDVKASNVLLDAEMNARLGDFGLARLHDRNTNPQTTHVVGTMGYIPPEAFRTRKPTIFTDVFAFGVFVLEVSCGRRPIELQDCGPEIYLVDWVFNCWKTGEILQASDSKLEGNYVTEETELALKLGLLCAHPKPEARPSMGQVVRFLDKDATIPDIPNDCETDVNRFFTGGTSSSIPPCSSGTGSLVYVSTQNSILQCGR